MVDGGNTDATNADVYFSFPPEALELHDDLMSKSPYLSDTVMKSSIYKEDVLPNVMIRDILVANPQSAKSDNVLGELDNRIIPMPEPMMNNVLEGKEIVGAKEMLESLISGHIQEENYLFGELMRYYIQDTTGAGAHDSLLALLQHRDSPDAKYTLAFELLSSGEIQTAQQVMNDIPSQFDLSTADQRLYHDYQTYFGILTSLASQNLTIYDIDQNHQSQLAQLTNEGSKPVQTYARNILLANELISYTEPIILPDENKSSPAGKENNSSSSLKEGVLKVFPNPAQQYVIVEYNFIQKYDNPQNLTLTILSNDGKLLYERKVTKSQDQILIDCRNLSSGLYLCRMNDGKEKRDSVKFVIVK